MIFERRYRGMSYKNVYDTPEYNEWRASQLYVLTEEFLGETENIELSDGYSVEVRHYSDGDGKVLHAYIRECTVKKEEEIIFSYRIFDGHTFVFKEFIEHANGRKYYPFHVDLYGICFLDIQSGESFCYVPEGWEHDAGRVTGESFIVTDIHYDKSSDLIAYGGCYWAGPYEVMVGDFSKPLDFNPRLVNIHNFLDKDYEEEFDFVQWTEQALVVKDDNGKEYTIPKEEYIHAINSLR